MGQVQNEEHLCLIAVIGMERPNKATVEWELERETEWRLGRTVCERETAETNAESDRGDNRESWCF